MTAAEPTSAILMNQYEVEKLPPDQQLLLDPAQPLPTTVWLVPEVHRQSAVLGSLVGGMSCIAIGVLSLIAAVAAFLEDDGSTTTVSNSNSVFGCFLSVGVVLVGIGIVMLLNARNRARAIRARARGEEPRIGLFLSPSGLLERGPFTYRYIPRERILGVALAGTAAQVEFQNDDQKPQKITLPENLANLTGAQTAQAVQTWLQRTTAV